MSLFSDILSFLKALRFVDFVFFFAVLVLMILIITLIYFIVINKEEGKVKEETAEMKIVKEIRENMNSSEPTINFNEYEKDQEEKAIISYDELLNKNSNYVLNYENEEVDDDFSVKKVNLDNTLTSGKNDRQHMEVRVISFAKEEAFLQALKQLQKELG